MNFVLVRAKTPKQAYPDVSQDKFLTMEKYQQLACRIIARFAPPSFKNMMLRSEDAIGFVAYKLMIADLYYNEEKSTINTFRGHCGKRAIAAYLSILRRQENRTKTKTNTIDAVTTFDGDGEANISDTIEDTHLLTPLQRHLANEERLETRKTLDVLMGTLNPTQRACIKMYYIDGMKQVNIARVLNLTRECVRKSLMGAMKKLKGVAGVQR